MANFVDSIGRRIDTANVELKEIRGLISSLMKSDTGPAKSYAPTESNTEGQAGSKLETEDANQKLKLLANSLQATADATKMNKEVIDKMSDAMGGNLQSMSESAQNFMSSFLSFMDSLEEEKQRLQEAKSNDPTAALTAAAGKGGAGGREDSPGKEDVESSGHLKELANGEKKKSSLWPELAKLVKAGLKKGSIHVSDDLAHQKLDLLRDAVTAPGTGTPPPPPPTTPSPPAGAGGIPPGGGRKGSAGRGDKPDRPPKDISGRGRGNVSIRDPQMDDWQALQQIIQRLHGYAVKMETMTFGFSTAKEALGGLVDKERDFIKDVRRAAYETAGVTGETHSLQKTYEAIGKTAKITGQNRTDTQQTYLSALKKGVKDQKTALDISTTQLNVATMLGLKSEDMGETFVDWHHQMRMNVGQLNDMNRGMRDVARYTGMTGKNLMEAVKSSQEFVKMLRNAATLTSQSAKNMMELTANAQKLGVAESLNPVMKGLASTSHLLTEASAQTRSLIFMAADKVGMISEAWTASIPKSKEGMKKFADGMEQVLKDFGVGSREEVNKLSAERLSELNLVLKAGIGMEVGEALQSLDAIRESSKTLSDRLDDVNDKRKSENLTLDETNALLEEERRLKTSAALSIMTALDESAKGAKSMEDALVSFGSRRGEFESDLNALGGSWTSNAQAARSAIEGALSNVNAGLKDVGKSEMTIDASRIEAALQDPKAFRELAADISAAEQEFAVAQKAQLDPMSQMEQHLREINDTLRNISSSFLSGLMNIAGGLLPLLAIVALVTQAGTGILGIIAEINSLTRGIDTMFCGGKMSKQSGFCGGDMGLSIVEKMTNKGDGALGEAANKLDAFNKKYKDDPDVKIVELPNDIMKNVKNETRKETGLKNFWGRLQETFTGDKNVTKVAHEKTHSIVDDLQLASLRAADEIKIKNNEAPIYQHIYDPTATPTTTTPAPTTGDIPTSPTSPTTSTTPSTPPIPTSPLEDIETEGLEAILKEHTKLFQDMRSILREIVKCVCAGEKIAEVETSVSQGATVASSETPTAKAEAAAGKGAAAEAPKSPVLDQPKPAKPAEAGTPAPTSATATPQPAANLDGGAPKGIGDQMLEKANAAAAEAPKLLKAAAIMGGIAIAVVALAGVLTMVTSRILKATGIDLGTATQTAMNIGALIGAAAAIAGAVVASVKGLEALNTFVEETKDIIGTLGAGALALLTLTPAVLGLALGVVLMAQGLSSMAGIGWDSALATAGTVGAILVAAGAIAAGVMSVIEPMQELKEFVDGIDVKKIAMMMLKGGLALLILAPALTFLAAGVTALVGGVMSMMGMDAGTAAKTAADVGALLLSASVIAVAIIGMAAGLAVLGILAKAVTGPQIELMIAGGIAFALLAPALTLLAAGVVAIIGGIMGMLGIDAGVAAKTAWDVGVLIGSAALIAVGIIGAIAGLAGLGVLAGLVTGPQIGLIFLGAAALLLLAPAMTALASAVVYMAKAVMGNMGIDSGVAGEVAKNLASILISAGLIAGGIIGSLWGLSLLGGLIMSGTIWGAIGLAAIGTIGLLALTPVVVGLAVAIVSMADAIMSKVGDAEKAAKVADSLVSIMISAGLIAAAVLIAVPFLGLLAGMIATAAILSVVLWAAVATFKLLTWPITGFIQATIDFAKALPIGPSEAAEMGEGVAGVLYAVGKVAAAVGLAAAGLAALGSWGLVLAFGPTALLVIAALWTSVAAFKILAAPVTAFVGAVVDFAKALPIGPSQAAEMGEGVAQVLSSVSSVVGQVASASAGLAALGATWALAGAFPLAALLFVAALWASVAAFQMLASPVTAFVGAVVNFAKGLPIEPSQAAEMGEGVAQVLSSVSSVVSKVGLASAGLAALGGVGLLLAFGPTALFFVAALWAGVAAFNILSAPVSAFVGAVVDFAKGLPIEPSQAAEMGEGVAQVLSAVGDVASKVGGASAKLAAMGATVIGTLGLGPMLIVGMMHLGVGLFKAIKQPIIDFVTEVVSFAIALGAIINPKHAQEVIDGVSSLIDMSTEVAGMVMRAASKLAILGVLSMFGGMIVGSMNMGVTLFNMMKTPITNFVSGVRDLATSMSESVDPADAKNVVKSVSIISSLVDQVSGVFDSLQESIVPLTQGGFFTSSPLEKMEAAKGELETFFPTLVAFVNEGIVKGVNDGMSELDKLKSAAKNIQIISEILKAVAPVMTFMGDTIAPMTDSGMLWGDSKIENIEGAIPEFERVFKQTAKFVNTGIVVPITENLSDTAGLKSAGRTIQTMALVLDATRDAIDSLANVAAIYSDGGFFTNSTAEDISAGLQDDALPKMIGDIASFVNDSIVGPISKNFSDPKALESTGKTMKMLACVMCDTKTMLTKLVDVVALMKPESFFSDSPLEQIVGSQDEFAKHFQGIASFMRVGIIEPIGKEFPDPSEIRQAGTTITILSGVATSLPALISGLSTAVGMASRPGLFQNSPMKKIVDNKNKFANYFKTIGEFMKGGIIDPTNATFQGVDVTGAKNTILAITGIAQAVPNLINNLASAMALMTSDSIWKDAPMETIIKNKKKFTEWFKAISIFMREGIIVPVLDELEAKLGEDSILSAARILDAIGMVVNIIPSLMTKIANEVIGLIDSGIKLDEAPIEKIMENKDKFTEWFRKVAIFIRDGIVAPILQEIPEEDLILEAARMLDSIGMVVNQLPNLFRNLSKVFGALNPADCFSESPLDGIVANIPVFTKQMSSFARFMREGIIQPIYDNFPNPEEVTSVAEMLSNMIAVVKMLPSFLAELSAVTGYLTFTMFGLIKSPAAKAYDSVGEFAAYFSGIANFLGWGIIYPILNYFPDSEGVSEAQARLSGVINVLRSLPKWLNTLNEEMSNLTSASWWNFNLSSSVPMFASYFHGIASAIGDGIINPIKESFASTDELPEIIGRMDGVTETIRKASDMMKVLGDELGPWVEPKSFFGGSKMSDAGGIADGFREQFAGIAKVITAGILNPIKNFFPPLAEIESTLATVEGIIGIFKGLDEMLTLLATTIDGMDAGSINLSKLNELDLAELGKTLSGVSGDISIASPSLAVTSGSTEALTGSHSGALTGAYSGKSILSAASTMQAPAMTREERIANIERLEREDLGISGSGIIKSGSGGISGSKAIIENKGIEGFPNKLSQNLGEFSGVNLAATSNEKILAHSKLGMKAQTDSLLSNISSISSTFGSGPDPFADQPVVAHKQSAEVEPHHPVDVHQRIQQEHSTSEPGISTVTSPDIARVAESSMAQVDLQTQMVQYLGQLADFLQPDTTSRQNASNEGGSTQTNYVSHRPAYYAKWTTGKHNQTPNKGVLNIGACNM